MKPNTNTEAAETAQTTDSPACSPASFKAADIVHHAPSGEEWVLAIDEEDGRLQPCGWPNTMADAKDCTLVIASTDAHRIAMLEEWAAEGKGHERDRDSRTRTARRQLALETNNRPSTTTDMSKYTDKERQETIIDLAGGYHPAVGGKYLPWEPWKLIRKQYTDRITELELALKAAKPSPFGKCKTCDGRGEPHSETPPQPVGLLGCPFCGVANSPYAALYEEDKLNRRPWGFVVRCPHCEAQGPRRRTCEEAEQEWNTRSSPENTDKI